MVSKQLLKSSLAALGLALAVAAPAMAQGGKFPERPLRLVVPFPAGGGVDALARLLADRLRPSLSVPIVVENKPGANGTVGGQTVKAAAADGHTILISASTHVMAQHVMRAAPYNPVTDFTPIARLGEAPMLVVISPTLPQRNLAEMVEAARKDPAKWSAATAALGSPGHIAEIALSQLAQINLTIVPYRGTAPALTDVAGGHVQLLIDAMVQLLPMAQSGQVKALAITTPKRNALAPEIPTAAESGLPGLEWVSWYGVWGPPGLPSDIVATLNTWFTRATRELAQSGRLAQLGIDPVEESPERFRSFMEAEVSRAAALLKAANFQPE
jgi:tripartite-type tricarboxylate transporter receptor subunit TctC